MLDWVWVLLVLVELDVIPLRGVAEMRGDEAIGTECVAVDDLTQLPRELRELGEPRSHLFGSGLKTVS